MEMKDARLFELPPPERMRAKEILTLNTNLSKFSVTFEYEPEKPGGLVLRYRIVLTKDQIEDLTARLSGHLGYTQFEPK